MTRFAPGDEPSGIRAEPLAEPFVGLEVATVTADTMRAVVRVSGTLTVATTPLLTSILRTHVTAGRRYLRVDLAGAVLAEPGVAEALATAHRGLARLGGTLTFDSAGPEVTAALAACEEQNDLNDGADGAVLEDRARSLRS